MSKEEIRKATFKSLEQFLSVGGTITVISPKKIKIKNPAACRYRRGVGSKSEGFKPLEPFPIRSWCVWSKERLNNINYH